MKQVFGLFIFLLLVTAAMADLNSLGIIPLKLEGGARYLGLGSAASSIAYDANAIFYNPGALVWSKGVALSAKGPQNITAAEAYPTGYGSTFGLGILLNSLPKVPNPQGLDTSLSSNALVLSAGTKLETLLPAEYNPGIVKNIGIGLNIKNLFNQSLSVSGYQDLSGTGWQLDLGLLYRYLSWIDLGFVGYNILPQKSLGGGELAWNNATAESIPSFFKIGASAKIVGDIRSPIYWQDNNILITSDLELGKNSLFHLGCEWTSSNPYILRAGLSQNLRQNEIQNDLSFGGGFRTPEWQFDIVFGKEPINGESAAYLSAVYFPSTWFFMAYPIEYISLKDLAETFKTSIEVTGKIRPEVKLFINSSMVEANPDGTFSYPVPLEIGENLVTVESRYFDEKQTNSYRVIRKKHPVILIDSPYLSGSQTVSKDQIEIVGTLPEGIESLYINGEPVAADELRNFKVSIPLKTGKNVIHMEGRYNGFSVSKDYEIFRTPPPKVAEMPEKKPAAKKAPIKERVARRYRAPAAARISKSVEPGAPGKKIAPSRLISYGTADRSSFSRFGNKKEKIWNALIEAGYIDREGRIQPGFERKKERFKLKTPLSAEEKDQVFDILQQAYYAKEFEEELAKEVKPPTKEAPARAKAFYFPSYGTISRTALSFFGKKRDKIWNALMEAGYIDEKGAILPNFENKREYFNLNLPLTSDEKNQVFEALQQTAYPKAYKEEQEKMTKEKQALLEKEISRKKQEEKIIQRASLEAEKIKKRLKIDQEKFEKLRALIKGATDLTIIKPIKIKLPPGYLSVYVLADERYLALKHLGRGRVAIDLYISPEGRWSTVAYLPYYLIKDLI